MFYKLFKFLAVLIVLVIILPQANAQECTFTIKGKILDSEYHLIPNAIIKTTKSKKIIRLNESGKFQFQYNYTKGDNLIVSCIGFENDTIVISQRKAKKYTKKGFYNLTIKLSPIQFEEVVITAKKVDTVFGSSEFSIADYILLKQDKILLLTYDKRIEKEAKLTLVNENQGVINTYSIPAQAISLYKDYAENNYLICKNKIYAITITNNEINLTPIKNDDFYGFYQRIIDTIETNYYYSNFTKSYPSVDFLVTNRLDSNHHKLINIQDDFMMELYRAQYKYVSGRDKLWAYRQEQKTGIDKEIWIGATSFTHDILYQPVYAPLFVIKDTIYIFDQYKNKIHRFDSDHDSLPTIKLDLKIKYSKEKWQQPLIEDKITESIYALYNKGGYYYLKRIDLQTGKKIFTLKLSNQFVEKVSISDNYVYYIYRPFESIQKKYLYREKIKR